ncbi:hypothetical protein VNO78_05284 [Psophocarpus tetragonolobus]|uniref:B box-type domain-containing protein n=1 Tax=Psophocarpus tetragonolobus TaxID=3891 RepID=A0AAN9XQS5_PSOTE
MKILCDVCNKEVASLFCPSDEAALCHACDGTIHTANKLADKHTRFSLHHPSSQHSPLCDICHDKRAYVFCKEDRAILCRECDLSIHQVNELTKKHNRFLLSGVKIGADADTDLSHPTSLISSNDTEVRTRSSSKTNRPSSLSNENITSYGTVGDSVACDTASVSTSSISQYLIETIPGYCMEDLLDASFASNGFSMVCYAIRVNFNQETCFYLTCLVVFQDYEHQSAFQNQHVEPRVCSWVPQFQGGSPHQLPQIDSLVGFMEMPKAKAAEGYSNWIYNYDYVAYKVPSISPPLIKKCKRSR